MGLFSRNKVEYGYDSVYVRTWVYNVEYVTYVRLLDSLMISIWKKKSGNAAENTMMLLLFKSLIC